mmetsp:Transcript_28022/g.65850  ORF Transcript_28022/g.65850 Transcript_28022/m.65850 type:complete len:366 (-) Transcript_28022:335-1432(-)
MSACGFLARVLLWLLLASPLDTVHSFGVRPPQPPMRPRKLALFAVTTSRKSGSGTNDLGLIETPDYLVTDSLDLDDADRPTMNEFVTSMSPREGLLRVPFLACGTGLSLCNVLGRYEEALYAPLVVACIGLGLANAVVDGAFVPTSRNIRRGMLDGRVLQLYAATYSASVCWLAARVYPPVCPGWLPALDGILGTGASLIFVGSLVGPALSLWSDADPDNEWLRASQTALVRLVRNDPTVGADPPRFTETETFRALGLLVIGFVACLYLPVAAYLALYGDAWWTASLDAFPDQGLLETSTALFGLIAAQANISITRAAGAGVRPLGELVGVGTTACLVLAVVPCGSALWFLRSGTTFFEHYQYVP